MVCKWQNKFCNMIDRFVAKLILSITHPSTTFAGDNIMCGINIEVRKNISILGHSWYEKISKLKHFENNWLHCGGITLLAILCRPWSYVIAHAFQNILQSVCVRLINLLAMFQIRSVYPTSSWITFKTNIGMTLILHEFKL